MRIGARGLLRRTIMMSVGCARTDRSRCTAAPPPGHCGAGLAKWTGWQTDSEAVGWRLSFRPTCNFPLSTVASSEFGALRVLQCFFFHFPLNFSCYVSLPANLFYKDLQDKISLFQRAFVLAALG